MSKSRIKMKKKIKKGKPFEMQTRRSTTTSTTPGDSTTTITPKTIPTSLRPTSSAPSSRNCSPRRPKYPCLHPAHLARHPRPPPHPRHRARPPPARTARLPQGPAREGAAGDRCAAHPKEFLYPIKFGTARRGRPHGGRNPVLQLPAGPLRQHLLHLLEVAEPEARRPHHHAE